MMSSNEEQMNVKNSDSRKKIVIAILISMLIITIIVIVVSMTSGMRNERPRSRYRRNLTNKYTLEPAAPYKCYLCGALH